MTIRPSANKGANCATANNALQRAGRCAPAKPTKCKDAKGKFAKCGTPGAKPV